VSGVRGVQDEGALGSDGVGLADVHDGWGEQAEAGVAVGVVVGVEELGAERPGVLERGEGTGEANPGLSAGAL